MKIQLLADPEYQQSFHAFFSSQSTFELVSSGAELVVDTRFLFTPTEPSETPLIVNTLTTTATRARKLRNAKSAAGIPMLPGYIARQSLIEYSHAATGDAPDAARLITSMGKAAEKIDDAIAGVFPRTLAMIINEAAFAVQEKVATPEDIDMAMKLGTNYPKGPLAWCDEIGASTVVAILDALAREYGSERYKVASILRRNAEAGIPFYKS